MLWVGASWIYLFTPKYSWWEISCTTCYIWNPLGSKKTWLILNINRWYQLVFSPDFGSPSTVGTSLHDTIRGMHLKHQSHFDVGHWKELCAGWDALILDDFQSINRGGKSRNIEETSRVSPTKMAKMTLVCRRTIYHQMVCFQILC